MPQHDISAKQLWIKQPFSFCAVPIELEFEGIDIGMYIMADAEDD